ncbi:hypothetical protein HK097_010837 [Rhizophlyctis rosea]|uniref:Uncharacterized protein n=1 Tax=Rhizophlyctis rosea TaxID=64517 RepID=A0AAD5SH30_9FUNG|nr:hypothetical protein HK097_010837 [Rhizophlyctis rosea]
MDPAATVLYIDTSGSFVPSRLKQLAEGSDQFAAYHEILDDALLRITCLPLYDAYDLLTALEENDLLSKIRLVHYSHPY